jgi:hypothetical protein
MTLTTIPVVSQLSRRFNLFAFRCSSSSFTCSNADFRKLFSGSRFLCDDDDDGEGDDEDEQDFDLEEAAGSSFESIVRFVSSHVC